MTTASAAISTGTVLSAREVTKSYGGTHALKGVSLGLAPGRVTALFGENGAGKSTLMKILAGIETPTTGQIVLDGDVIEFSSPRQAADNGVVIIHQELSLCPNMSIQDNLFLAREQRGRFGNIDRASQRRATEEVLQRLEEHLDPDLPVGDLRIGQQQLVEIARALLQNARVLIMDEPTSALSMTEVDVLFRVIRELTAQGVAVIYISHHLEESLEIADDVAVLRDGQLVATATADEVDLSWVVQNMVGRDQDSLFPKRHAVLGEIVLKADGVTVADPSNPNRLSIDEIDLEIHAGEIVGIYGLMASGRTELLEAIAGRLPITSGQLTFAGNQLDRESVRERIRRGIALVPEDRQRDGLVQTMSVGQNLSLSSLKRYVQRGFITRANERDAVDRMITDVTVKTAGSSAPIGSLSGGNQQKVVIGKALLTGPKVLLLDEPSRGVDIGAKADIFALMTEQAENGLAVIFTTSEAEEALHIPDRLLVLERGRLVADLDPHVIDRGRLMELADGSARNRTGEQS
jgi:erythritol transport system ATP-binding protein